MAKKLYEFSALVQFNYVVAADSEESARKAIDGFEKAWCDSGDFICVSDVSLSSVRQVSQDCLEVLAHEIV